MTHTFSFDLIDSNCISKIINDFKPKTSAGHDNFTMVLLKGLNHVVSKPISLIINQSLTTGIFPTKLKLAKVIPVFKKGDESTFENYRPISLLPAFSKVFERVVYDQLYEYFVSKSLFYKSQHGFKKQHSTETAALEFIDRIVKFLDNGKLPVAVYLDLSKAFDTLDHNILLHKLNHYGVTGNSLNWFKDYLTDRKQYVHFDGACSNVLPLSMGVPQGSILGPLLFIIYTNDIYRASSKFESILYADDTTLINSVCSFELLSPSSINENDVSDSINVELQNVYNWLAANKLSLNITKTKYMLFHFPQKQINFTLDLKIDGISLDRTVEFNFLGLTVHEHLNWTPHLNKIGNKLSKVIGIFKRINKFVPTSSLLLMYNSLFLSHLNYSILAWGYSSGRIFSLQKKAVRIISKSSFNAHTDPLFKQLKILKLQDIFKLKALKFYFRYKNNEVPNYFQNIFETFQVHHSYNTRHRGNASLPIPARSRNKKCIRFYIPNLVKNTPPSIIDKIFTHSYHGFSTYTKLFFINKYQDRCTVPNCYVCSNQRL